MGAISRNGSLNSDIARGPLYYNYEMCDFLNEEMSGNSIFYKNENR